MQGIKISRKELLFIFLITFIPIFLVYIPFIFKFSHFFFLTIKEPGFANVLKNWDGPHYAIVAKSWYDVEIIKDLIFIPINTTYYAAHFPLFPLFMKLLTPFFDIFKSGLIMNLIFGFLLNIVFFNIAKTYTKKPLFLTLLFTVFPPRFWVVRSIIAPEPLMLLLILLSLHFWNNKQYFLSSVFGMFSVFTKIQALFLFPAYIGELIEDKILRKRKMDIRWLWIILIPLAFIFLSIFYYYRVGDFFAFLKAEKQNNLFFYFPFSQFNYLNTWGGTAWLEDIAFYFLGAFVLIASLFKSKNRSWFYLALFYTLFLTVIPQRDVTRFMYPLLPMFLLQFEKFLTSDEFVWGFFFGSPALYFYTVNFMLVNQAPIADWTKLLR